MKRFSLLLSAVLAATALTACNTPGEELSSGPAPTAAVQLTDSPARALTADSAERAVGEMMALDRGAMSVTEFHETVETICTERGTTLHTVLADVYERSRAWDSEREDFVSSTLEYSSAQLFGEPVYSGAVSYIATADLTARDMLEKRRALSSAQYDSYYEERVADIRTLVNVFYRIDFAIPDSAQVTVAQRDTALGGIRSGIEDFVVSMSEEAVTGPDARKAVEAKLTALCQEYGSDRMAVVATLQNIENFEERWI